MLKRYQNGRESKWPLDKVSEGVGKNILERGFKKQLYIK